MIPERMIFNGSPLMVKAERLSTGSPDVVYRFRVEYLGEDYVSQIELDERGLASEDGTAYFRAR